MAKIIIETTEAEQEKVLKALREVEGDVIAVSAIASRVGLPQSKTRYVLMDLEEKHLIKKIPHRNFNKHYVRYSYKVLDS